MCLEVFDRMFTGMSTATLSSLLGHTAAGALSGVACSAIMLSELVAYAVITLLTALLQSLH
jgi:hypothetical protein